MASYSFTSESVCSGHPDKICDSISDSVLDAILKQDPYGRVAVETVVTFERTVILGEITANASVDIEKIARKRIKRLGYSEPSFNFWYKSPVEVYVHEQSPEIAAGVHPKGAGDQGMMFGFACRESKNLMPLPITLAHELAKKIDKVREAKSLPYLRPDGKTQVTLDYKNGIPHKVTQVVIAVPHSEKVKVEEVKSDIYTSVVKVVLEKFGFTIKKKDLIVNGTGIWHMPGPGVDSGLTGRKTVVDTYGGYARIGGGCFSGKDPTKVDRSGAYAARYISKNIVANKLADKAEVRLAYYIGAKKPVMQEVETFGTEKKSKKVIKDFMSKILDTSVEDILQSLKLRAPIYLPTSTYGHFGRSRFSWEKIVRL